MLEKIHTHSLVPPIWSFLRVLRVLRGSFLLQLFATNSTNLHECNSATDFHRFAQIDPLLNGLNPVCIHDDQLVQR